MIDWQIALTAAICTAAALCLWWFRDRHLAEQRRGMRALYTLSEEIISSRSPSEILRQLLTTLPKVAQVTGVRLYLFNTDAKTLDRVPSSLDPDPLSLSISEDSAAAICMRNRAPLTIPDASRSPLYNTERESDPPRSVMMVPMHAEDDVLGVLELNHTEGLRRFSLDQQAAAQHLANQVAIALKLQAQHSMQEQLFRSEKLAAAGRLVSGVVTELEEPLRNLAAGAEALASRHGEEPLHRDLASMSLEARRASTIVSRLVNFSRNEQPRAVPVDLGGLLGELMRFREREWRVRGVRLHNLLDEQPLTVLGSAPQLEQVFLNLFIHAEHSLERAREKTITVGARLMARQALIEIGFSATAAREAPDPFLAAEGPESSDLGLPVCRGIIQSHGGEIRLRRDADGESRFEVELPLAPAATRERTEIGHRQQKGARQITVLLVEPDPSVQHQLTSLLSARGHRVVPVVGAGEAVDLAQRLQFDLVCSSTSLPGTNWVELYERIRHLVSAFVLVTEGYNADISRAFQSSDSFVLAKPVDESEFDRLLSSIEATLGKPSLRSSH